MDIPEIFLSNVRIATKHLNLSEDDINNLLQDQKLKYSESSKNVSLKLAYCISLIFDKKVDDFITENFHPFDFDNISPKTQEYLSQKEILNEEDKVISKFINAYVIIVIKDFPKGAKFTNSEILICLPPVLNLETSIDWTSGLLKGLVENTFTYRKSPDDQDARNRGEAIYLLKESVPATTIHKAIKKVDPLWLKKFLKSLIHIDSKFKL